MSEYRIDLPYQSPPKTLRGNARCHWAARAKETSEVRHTVSSLVKSAGVPKCEFLTVQLFWAPGDRRRRDEDNLWPLLKVCCDAIARGRKDWVGLELVPDDTPQYMDKMGPRILTPDDTARVGMWLTIATRDASIEPEIPGQVDMLDLLKEEAS